MKYIITESQFKTKIYDKFLNKLVKETEIFGGKKHKYMSYEYVAFIKYPHSEKIPSDLAFNDPEEYTFTTPGGLMEEWLQLIGVDIKNSPYLGKQLWDEYLDRLRIKVIDYIQNYIN